MPLRANTRPPCPCPRSFVVGIRLLLDCPHPRISSEKVQLVPGCRPAGHGATTGARGGGGDVCSRCQLTLPSRVFTAPCARRRRNITDGASLILAQAPPPRQEPAGGSIRVRLTGFMASLATMQALRRPATATRLRAAALITTPTRASSSSPAPRPKKPSPYRLPHLPSFLSSFAPLHASGWRLDRLPLPLSSSGAGGSTHSAGSDMLSGADLQDRVLVRAFAFPPTREGWRDLAALMGDIARAVEAHDVGCVVGWRRRR